MDLLSPGQLFSFIPHESAVHPDLTAQFNLDKSPGSL